MVENQNRLVTERLSNDLKIQTLEVPTKVAASIVPVVVSNPERTIDILKSASTTATGGVAIYSTPSNQDFYISAVAISAEKDAACDNTGVVINCVVNGATVSILNIAFRLGVAQAQTATLTLPIPIKVDRGTTMYVAGNFAAGNMTLKGNVLGYLVNPL